MVRATSEKVGRGACPCCGESVMYRQTSGGKLSFACDACDLSGYMPAGSEAERKALATIKTPIPKPAPEPAPKGQPQPAPEPSPAPAPKAARSVFDLANL